MVKFDGRNVKIRWFDASRYRNRRQILKLGTPILVTLLEGIGKFIIPVKTGCAGLLQYLFAKKDEWRDEAHGIEYTCNRGEDFASCINLLGRVDGVEKVVVIDVLMHPMRSFVLGF